VGASREYFYRLGAVRNKLPPYKGYNWYHCHAAILVPQFPGAEAGKLDTYEYKDYIQARSGNLADQIYLAHVRGWLQTMGIEFYDVAFSDWKEATLTREG
jgi:hypothetical protein